jgi:CRP-like cAMP-binding protein
VRQTESYLTRKIGVFVKLSASELGYLEDLQAKPIHLSGGTELVHEGGVGQTAYIFESGWACSFKSLADGGRQIISFPVPGDCVGLRSMLLRTSDHSLTTVTDATVIPVEARRLREMFSEFPYLGTALLWATSRDEAMIVEHLVSLGRRDAMERTAHFILELHDRLQLVGIATKQEFDCPLNQLVLADVLGLSTVHVNRVLRLLRERELVTFRDHKVTIHDLEALKTLAGYVSPPEAFRIVR